MFIKIADVRFGDTTSSIPNVDMYGRSCLGSENRLEECLSGNTLSGCTQSTRVFVECYTSTF